MESELSETDYKLPPQLAAKVKLATTSEIIQEIFDRLCHARDNADTMIVETVLDQVIQMVVRAADDNQIALDRRNRLIASI